MRICKKKFYQLTPSERRSQLVEKGVLTQENALIFEEQTLSEELSDHMIENQVSEVETPMGIAQNFQINGKKNGSRWLQKNHLLLQLQAMAQKSAEISVQKHLNG